MPAEQGQTRICRQSMVSAGITGPICRRPGMVGGRKTDIHSTSPLGMVAWLLGKFGDEPPRGAAAFGRTLSPHLTGARQHRFGNRAEDRPALV